MRGVGARVPFFALLMLCLFASGARAQDGAISAAAPQRLQLYALAYENLDQNHAAIDAHKRSHALDSGPSAPAFPHVLDHGLHISPLLSFDSNINGGTPGDVVMIGGLPFALKPDARAVAGVMAGAQLGITARAALAHGRVVTAQGSAAIARQIGGDLHTTRTQVQLCGAQYLGAARWFDLCAQRDTSQRALARSRAGTVRAGLQQSYKTARGFGQIDISLARRSIGAGGSYSAAMALTLADMRGNLTQIQAEVGAPAAGQMARLFAASAAQSVPIFGAQSAVFTQISRDAGGQFFGQTRQDTSFVLGMTHPLGARHSITLSGTRTRSSVANFTATTLGLTFNFQPRRF